MPRPVLLCAAILLWLLTFRGAPLLAQAREEAIVRTATLVLHEIMAIPAKRIPQSLMANAEGLAIIPDVVKVGLIGGVRHGSGVLLVRDSRGRWTAPSFITLTGGSVGWQAGIQATDAVLVFNTRRSVEGLAQGKFTIGVDAAAAAGPVGRQAGAATDAYLQAEIFTYSRSRGLFAGVSIDGSAIQIDGLANAHYYRAGSAATPSTPPGQLILPESAIELLNTVALYTPPGEVIAAQFAAELPPASAGWPPPALPPADPIAAEAAGEDLRRQLAAAAVKLNALLDDRWRQFLAVPSEILSGTGVPPIQALHHWLANYDRVAADPQYRALSLRPEFQTTHDLLRRYIASRSTERPDASMLPPPPSQSPIDTRVR